MIGRLLRMLRLAAHGRHATGGYLPPTRDHGDDVPAMLSPGGPAEAAQCRHPDRLELTAWFGAVVARRCADCGAALPEEEAEDA